jgi:hypothetical protein
MKLSALMGVVALSIVARSALHGAERRPRDLPPGVRETTVEVRFTAGFLRPRADFHSRPKEEEILFGPVEWDSDRRGIVQTRIWDLNSVIEFECSPDRRQFTSLVINPPARGGPPLLWDVWRHRHAYVLVPGQGYFWNGLEDEKEPLAWDDGVFYDRYLRSLWTFWVMKRLPRHLAGEESPAGPLVPTPPVVMAKDVRLRYDNKGLVRPVSVPFQISVWNVPVKVLFDVVVSTGEARSADDPLHYRSRWSYDRSEWRRLHGYSKNVAGYDWDGDFPRDVPLTEESGVRLDRLLDRTVAYWVSTAVEQISESIDRELKAAIYRR